MMSFRKKNLVKTENASRQSLTPLRMNALEISRPIKFTSIYRTIRIQGQTSDFLLIHKRSNIIFTSSLLDNDGHTYIWSYPNFHNMGLKIISFDKVKMPSFLSIICFAWLGIVQTQKNLEISILIIHQSNVCRELLYKNKIRIFSIKLLCKIVDVPRVNLEPYKLLKF